MDGTKRRGCTCRWSVSHSHNRCNDPGRQKQKQLSKWIDKVDANNPEVLFGKCNTKMRHILSMTHTYEMTYIRIFQNDLLCTLNGLNTEILVHNCGKQHVNLMPFSY